jgi:hypothetical protein
VIGGIRFASARARAASAPLITLGVVAALSALLMVGVAGLVASVETREVRGALASASGDRARVVLTVDADASADDVADAAIDALGPAGRGLSVSAEDGDVVLAPDLDQITSSQALALADGLAELRSGIDDRIGVRPQESGSLRDTLVDVREGIDARRGPTAVALGLLGLLTAVVIAAVSLEPVRARETETALLRARGARRRELVWLGAVEAFAVALAGAVAGAAAGAAATIMWAGSPDLVVAGIAAVAVATVAGLVVAVVTARGADRRSSRARVVADIGALVLLAVVTALAVWQFTQAGTPVVVRGDGTAVLDPLVALAPALALGLAAVVAVALATPIARAAAAAFAPSRRVSPATPLRLASRRPARHALSITVVAFAIGSITVAGAFQSSLTALGDAPEALRVGADVKVGTIPEDIAAADVAAAGSPQASMLARSMSAQGADERIPILAVQTSQLGDVMLDAGGTIDPAALGATLAPAAGPALAGDQLAITLDAPPADPVEVEGGVFEPGPAALEVQATVVAESGEVLTFRFANADVEMIEDDNGGSVPDIRARPSETATFPLPEGEDWSLAALAVAYHPAGYVPGGGVITRVVSGSEPVDLSGFRPAAGTPGSVEVTDAGLSFAPEAAAGQPFTRAVSPATPLAVPAAITSGLAGSMSLEVGDTIALGVIKPDFDAEFEIVEIIPVLPGSASGEGMLVDLGTLSLSSPFDIVPTQAWLAAYDPGAVAAAVSEQFPQTVTTVADPRAAENAAGTAWAFILAAAGAFVLAVAVLVLRRTRTRGDSKELALLAVMGLGRTRASRLRAQEDLFAVAMGVVGGIAAGAVTSWLIVAPLVRAAYGSVPEAYPVELRADPLALLGAMAIAVAVFCAVVASVRSPAMLAPLLREDE